MKKAIAIVMALLVMCSAFANGSSESAGSGTITIGILQDTTGVLQQPLENPYRRV